MILRKNKSSQWFLTSDSELENIRGSNFFAKNTAASYGVFSFNKI